MISSLRRFLQLLRSRRLDARGLTTAADLDGVARWSGGPLLGFNGSPIRAKVVHALARAFGATVFVETGTYHGATAVCASVLLGLPVISCERAWRRHLVARLTTLGLLRVTLRQGDSPTLVGRIVGGLGPAARPLFYLDAHGDDDPGCPLVEELRQVVRLDEWVAVIDDFEVPDSDFIAPRYGDTVLDLSLIRPVLTGAGIERVFVPAYEAARESGYGRTGWAVVVRSPQLDARMRRGDFPFNLLRGVELGPPVTATPGRA